MVHVLPILLLLLPAAISPVAHAGRGHGHSHLVVATSSLKPSAVCSGLRVNPSSNRTWSPLYHRRGPCSPFRSAESATSTAEGVLFRDQLRADSIRKKIPKKKGASARRWLTHPSNATAPRLQTSLGTSLKTLEYVVTVGIGTPAVPQTVLVDTASDLSWVQCRPCPVPGPCHAQKDAFFDPAKSSTFSYFSFCSAACARLGANNSNACLSTSLCNYIITYSDNTNTTGTYSSDTLTLASSVMVRGFRFGCSHADLGFTERTAGIMALGGGTESLVSQTGKKAFSYCLPPTASQTGFLTLGVPRISSSRFAVTPMYRSSRAPTFHIVLIKAIAVAGRRLDVPASVFSAGTVMDSGTVITRLPPMAYHALRTAFRAEMKMYPPARPRSILDTCFNLTGVSHVKLPRVALVFDRGAIEICPVLRAFSLFEIFGKLKIKQNSWLSHLRELTIHNCPHLTVSNPLPPSSSVCKLSIARLPTFPTMVGSSSGELRIENHRNEFSFELTKLDGKILSFHDLRALTFFVIAFCQDLSSISLEGFKQLISLKSLEIKHCKKLFSVVPLEQIHEDTADASFNAFPSLEYLKIESSGIAGKWLSVMLRHAPALQELHLRSCQQISGLLMEGKENSLSSSSAPPRNPDDALTSSTPDGLLCIPSNLIPSLKKMLVVGCPDLTFEMSKEGFSGFTSLEELTISNCPELVPSLVHKDENNDQGNGRWLLPHSLVKLRFDDDTTETLQLCFQENRNCLKELEVTASPSLKCLQLHSFTALEELSIEECESLADLDGISTCLKTLILSLNRSLKSLQLRSCTALEKLSIEKCESLAELEGNSTWLKELELSNNQSLKSVQLHCCTALEELEIRRCHLLAALEGLQSLSGLRQLRVSDCPGLPPCLECLPSTRGYELFPRLEILEIDDHSFLTTSFCTHLTSLQRLEIWDCKEVRILTDEQEAAFLFLKSLKELSVLRCENLEHLPLGLHSLRSLKRLEIYNSPCISWLLTVLPLSLEELEVTGCSMELTERCRMLATDKLKVKIGGRYVN